MNNVNSNTFTSTGVFGATQSSSPSSSTPAFGASSPSFWVSLLLPFPLVHHLPHLQILFPPQPLPIRLG